MATLVDVRQRIGALRPEIAVAVGLSVLLVAYGNAVSTLPHDVRTVWLLWLNLAVMALLLVWALRSGGFSPGELGLKRRYLGPSALLGLVLSVLAAIPPVLFVVFAPLFNGGAVESDGITERSGAGLAFFVLFRQPIGTALFEEVAFRGVLYGAWLRAGADRAAVLGTSIAFAVWHTVITSRTVIESGVVETPLATAAGILVSLLGLFVGGVLFAFLRMYTRSIAAPFMAHWLVVALMTVAVWTMA